MEANPLLVMAETEAAPEWLDPCHRDRGSVLGEIVTPAERSSANSKDLYFRLCGVRRRLVLSRELLRVSHRWRAIPTRE